jgi:hypothetical protein
MKPKQTIESERTTTALMAWSAVAILLVLTVITL